MPYESVGDLQNALADTTFSHTADRRKAAGRSLGTILEAVTFHLLVVWGFLSSIRIETRLPEFGNRAITHNVEFALFPIENTGTYELEHITVPITPAKLFTNSMEISHALSGASRATGGVLLDSSHVQRNAAQIGTFADGSFMIANLSGYEATTGRASVQLTRLAPEPFAMVECKRVGIEEGAGRGPTTIEKAKQGAYVATHVSSLQKVWGLDGGMYGVLPLPDGTFEIREWEPALDEMVYDAPLEAIAGFILTIGVASNHGNWFTDDSPNKEMLVLKQSYDWLLFLRDEGLAEFVTELLQSPGPVQEAFVVSYTPRADGRKPLNRFTKVRMSRDAHLAFQNYVQKNLRRIESDWLEVVSPEGKGLADLKDQLNTLIAKKLAAEEAR